ncbi:MAG TPA: glycosyltransferase [Spirochaetota bacterium]|nr:glycosyltransferase [Spirochaetota bacterium]
MAKVDLHVHSKYSEHPSEWFLQRIGAKESYIDPEFVYKTAKEKGMNFVTLTDHNRIDGAILLKQKYDDVFISMEATTYFPENNCKIHLLVYDINENQYNEISRLRSNIYDLREYVKAQKIVSSLAHATFSINGKLTLEYLEKLMLMFDTFEGVNGARNKMNNNVWMNVLKHLSPEKIEDLYKKYRIEPMSDTPWIKNFTGGSDDHAGFFIGQTYTVAEGKDYKEYLSNVFNKKSYGDGRHNDYQSLAFSIYKIAYDFSKTKSDKVSQTILSYVNELIFERKNLTFTDKIKMLLFKSRKKKNDKIKELLIELSESIFTKENQPIEKRLEIIYEKLATVSDEMFKNIFISIQNDISKGNVLKLVNRITSSFAGVFLSIPFISTFKLLFQDRELLNQLLDKYVGKRSNRPKRILWFTDTIDDLNGVSMTLKTIASIAHSKEMDLTIVTALTEDMNTKKLPPNVIGLPIFHSFEVPHYEELKIYLPSLLKSLKQIYLLDPDEIYISTPITIGLLGLLAGKLLNVKVKGVYHTDFTMQTRNIVKDDAIVNLIEFLTKWFYSQMDEIKVPTKEYINILEERGFDKNKMSVFRRGIDNKIFAPVINADNQIEKDLDLKDGINLLYAGRVSEDKNIDFLISVYKKVREKHKKINLIIAGDGPYLKLLKERHKKDDRIIFVGNVKRDKLPIYYSASDLFVFPSITDTFGMVVLEAQTTGLPALVSNIGGPKEIVIDGKTGFIAIANNFKDWENKLEHIVKLIQDNPDIYFQIKKEARRNCIENYDWDRVLKDIMEE